MEYIFRLFWDIVTSKEKELKRLYFSYKKLVYEWLDIKRAKTEKSLPLWFLFNNFLHNVWLQSVSDYILQVAYNFYFKGQKPPSQAERHY